LFTTVSNVLPIFLCGTGAGLLGALLGVGGGVLLVPILVLGLDVPMHYAVATSIVSVIATSSAAAIANVEYKTANMRLGMTLEIATCLGAIAGGSLAAIASPKFLHILFAGVVFPTGIAMWRGKSAETPLSPDSSDTESNDAAITGEYFDPMLGRSVFYRVRRLWAAMAVSFLAGNLSGLLGVGGGAFKVPALTILCGVPMKAAAATSNFMIGVTAAASAFLYYGRGEVRPALTAAVVLGVLIGSRKGASLSRRVKSDALRKGFAVLLFVIAVQMLRRALTE